MLAALATQTPHTTGTQHVENGSGPERTYAAPYGTTDEEQEADREEQALNNNICRGRCQGAGIAVCIALVVMTCATFAWIIFINYDTMNWIALVVVAPVFLFGPLAYLCWCTESTPEVYGWAQGMAIAHGVLSFSILCAAVPLSIIYFPDKAWCDDCHKDRCGGRDRDDVCHLGHTLRGGAVLCLWGSFAALMLAFVFEIIIACYKKKHCPQQHTAAALRSELAERSGAQAEADH